MERTDLMCLGLALGVLLSLMPTPAESQTATETLEYLERKMIECHVGSRNGTAETLTGYGGLKFRKTPSSLIISQSKSFWRGFSEPGMIQGAGEPDDRGSQNLTIHPQHVSLSTIRIVAAGSRLPDAITNCHALELECKGSQECREEGELHGTSGVMYFAPQKSSDVPRIERAIAYILKLMGATE